MTIEQLNKGPCKTYLVADDISHSAALIDPTLEFVSHYLEILKERGLTLTHVFDTHTHADHVSGAALLRAQTGCEYVMYKTSDVKPVSVRVDDGDVIKVGAIAMTAIFTPGHSKDSMCLVTPEALFSGDTLFLNEGGAGRDDLYSGDSHAHAESLERLKKLDDSLMVYPGHDYRDRVPSTLSEQKKHNQFLRFVSAEEYIDFCKKLKFGPADWMKPIVQLNTVGATSADVLEDPQVAAAREANACEPYQEVAGDMRTIAFTSSKDLGESLAAGAPVVILDVREAYEFEGPLGVLPEVVHIPVQFLDSRLAELTPFKDKKIIVICKTGNRARTAASLLLQNGFTNVTVLDGGMAAYRMEENTPVASGGDIIYLDHAATTYLDPKVVEAMTPYFQERFGNPSSLYSVGRIAGEAIENARARIAALFNIKPREIFFAAGGTESINMAIFGVAYSHAPGAHLITTAIEHSAVLNSFRRLEKLGYAATYVPVDAEGFITLEDLKATVRPETVLISIGYANNEIGTIQPVKEIARWLREINGERVKTGLNKILLHTDACQAAGYLDMDMQALGADLVTVNGSKLYGPKQMGILFVREGIELVPIIFGGGQERGARSGTENVPSIVGFATALEVAQGIREKESARLRELRDYLITQVLTISDSRLNGPAITNDKNTDQIRLPNNANFSFSGVAGEALLIHLDRFGICVSTGSACHSKESGPSHVLVGINCGQEFLEGSLRMTLGKVTTKAQLDQALKILNEGIALLRKNKQ